MELGKAFHMNGGLGLTGYSHNSSLQRRDREIVKHVIRRAVVDAFLAVQPACLSIADLGCSSGPNALLSTEGLVGAVKDACRKSSLEPPEFMVFLNDLPSNDFNSVFVGVPEFIRKAVGGCGASVFMSGVPGSFYRRLFPSNSLHFIHSSYSLHWLSQAPISLLDGDGKSTNKGRTYLSTASSFPVQESYLRQFQDDFSLFLRLRSRELGEVREEEVDSYNAHFYAPSLEEIEVQVEREGSFAIECLELFEGKGTKEDATGAGTIAMSIRAIQEPLLRQHFREDLIEKLFDVYNKVVERELTRRDVKSINIVSVLKKLA
ncbi:unnamed protein product [Spirodela intermedia]|uniref:Uncharacterized protein n=1 Tax=Spirodela intermedia TaxID=51605 RepID=A0A7I8J575_SPIIN|nr:unnamed protein product [Spirodela intermedia]CAA6665251.1 unnamed protein product [Spirodela intermedia]